MNIQGFRENQTNNNSFYQQPLEAIENHVGDEESESESESQHDFVDETYQQDSNEVVAIENQTNQNQESRLFASIHDDDSKAKVRGRKKATNQTLIEGSVPQGSNIIFSLPMAEATKLSAIATLLGYQNLSLFAKELVVKGIEPYFQTASQVLKEQHFNQK